MAMEDAVALLWLSTIYTLFKLSEKAEIEEMDVFFRLLAYLHAVGGLGVAYTFVINGDASRVVFAFMFMDALILSLLFLLIIVRYVGKLIKTMQKLVSRI